MKNPWVSATVSLAAFIGLDLGLAKAAPPPAQDSGSEVLRVFATKCAHCHGSDLARPKGRFGYVLDLQRLAADPEKVIPLRPTESELWMLVEAGEMPPADSPRGPLSPAEKEVIREWIAAGAPDPSAASLNTPPSSRPELAVAAAGEIVLTDRIVGWLGKFHLLFVHLPIALVLAAGLGEVRSVWQRNRLPSEPVRFCLWLGALAAIPTAGLGWLFAAAGNGGGSPQLLTAHRLLGTTTAAWLVVTAIRVERDSRRGARSRTARLLLTVGVLITALTAHLGGLLDRGVDFFNY